MADPHGAGIDDHEGTGGEGQDAEEENDQADQAGQRRPRPGRSPGLHPGSGGQDDQRNEKQYETQDQACHGFSGVRGW